MSRRHQQINLNNQPIAAMTYDGLAERLARDIADGVVPRSLIASTHTRGKWHVAKAAPLQPFAIKKLLTIARASVSTRPDVTLARVNSLRQKNCLLKLQLACKGREKFTFCYRANLKCLKCTHLRAKTRRAQIFASQSSRRRGSKKKFIRRRWRSVEMPDKTCCTMAIESIIIAR